MKLYLSRGDAATNGLIAVTTDETSFPYYGMHKPTELEQLKIFTNFDGAHELTLVIGQYKFTVLNVDLFIEGVDQSAETLDSIKASLSLLFLDSSAGGGGGGGTINPTDEYVPYRLNAGAFADSSIRQSIAPGNPNPNDFKLDFGKEEISISLHNDNSLNPNTIKKMIIGNAQPVTSPYNIQKIIWDFLLDYMNVIVNNFTVGETNVSKSVLQIDQTAETIALGDMYNNGNSTQFIINDLIKSIQFYAGSSNLNFSLDGDAAVNKALINAASMRLELDGVNAKAGIGNLAADETSVLVDNAAGVKIQAPGKIAEIGDTSYNANSTLITIDDTAGQQVIFFNSAPGKYIFATVPEFANNADAITGGLALGGLFRITGTGNLQVRI